MFPFFVSFSNQGRRTAPSLVLLRERIFPASPTQQIHNTSGFQPFRCRHHLAPLPFLDSSPLRVYSPCDAIAEAGSSTGGTISQAQLHHPQIPTLGSPMGTNPHPSRNPSPLYKQPLTVPSPHHHTAPYTNDMLSSMRPQALDPSFDPTNRWWHYDTPPPSDKKTLEQDGRRDGSRQGVCNSIRNVATKDEWRCRDMETCSERRSK